MNIGIVNRCLNLMGAQSVTDISNSEWAKVINSLVPTFYRILLEDHKWLFATKYAELAQNTTNENVDYEYSFGLPSTLVRVYNVYQGDNTTEKPLRIKEWRYTTDANNIYTSIKPIIISYTSIDSSIDLAPESFKLALSYLILSNVAMVLMNNTQLVPYYKKMAMEHFNSAVNVDFSNKGEYERMDRPRVYL